MEKSVKEKVVIKRTTSKRKQYSSKVLLNAGSILLGGVLISMAIFFSGDGFTFGSTSIGNTNTQVAGECTGENRFGEGCYDKFAQELDLDTDKFKECVEQEKFSDVIDKELAAGQSYGVQGTPSFYIGKGKGDEFEGFYVGGIRLAEIENLVTELEKGDVNSANKYWTNYLTTSITEFEPQVREYYSSAEGGSLTGEALDNTVSTYINEQLSKIGTDYIVSDLTKGDGLVQGDGEIVFMEFSDYECPYCQSFANEVLVEAKEKFVDTGKARYIYRDFPLESIHPSARSAANAARCAGEQGKYFEYHDKLFEVN